MCSGRRSPKQPGIRTKWFRIMGSSASAAQAKPPSPPPPEALDPRLPFNPREAFKLKNYWKVIARKMSETGVEMLIRLMLDNPEFTKLKLFASFGDDEAAWRTSEELDNLGQSVLMSIDKVINNFDDIDSAIAHLQSVGKMHSKLDGLTPDSFVKMRDAFIYSAKMTFEDRYNDQVEQSFDKLFTFCLKYLQEGFTS